MNKLEFEKFLKQQCPWVSNETFEKFEIYKNVLQTHNQKMNLSRLVDNELIYEQYFLNSLLPFIKLDYFKNSNNDLSLLDIGTGSGIPGVVLKIIFPSLKLTLLEANTKKCVFLKILLKELNFNDVEIINDRCENCYKQYIEKFDIVTSRAVSSLNKILELSASFSKINGHIICLKSKNYLIELNEATNAIKVLDLKLINTITYNQGDHYFITLDFLKSKSTDSRYPRIWNKILNNPL